MDGERAAKRPKLPDVSFSAVQACAARACAGVVADARPHVVAFDTETTGFRGAVIQAALVELDGRGREVRCVSGLVMPPLGVVLEPGAVAVHGITSARLAHEALPNAREFLEKFVHALRAARACGKAVCAHNKSFDVERLNETLCAHGSTERLNAELVYCTMRGAKSHCGLANAAGRPRFPKNEELYHILTGGNAACDAGGALHDAARDARVTARSYLEGRTRGWFP